MTRHSYPIIGNCNFESRDDTMGRAIHAARKAAEAGLVEDGGDLAAALHTLEETLAEHADGQHEPAITACRDAEEAVAAAYAAAREGIEAAREARYA